MIIVGFVSKAVDEARERIRSAFAASNLTLPRKRITINLAPADVPKESAGFDLGVATAILAATNQIRDRLLGTAIMGELGLEGDVRPIRGIIGKVLVGKRHGLTRFIIPAGNLEQAVLVPGVQLVPVSTLSELYKYLNDPALIPAINTDDEVPAPTVTGADEPELGLEDVIGQELGKRAVEISAAERFGLSARAYMRTVKVARTIADLDASEAILPTHIAPKPSNTAPMRTTKTEGLIPVGVRMPPLGI